MRATPAMAARASAASAAGCAAGNHARAAACITADGGENRDRASGICRSAAGALDRRVHLAHGPQHFELLFALLALVFVDGHR